MKASEQLTAREPIHVKTGARLALLLTIPALVSLFIWLFGREVARQSDAVENTLSVELSVERLLSDFERAENSLRSYVLTGEDRFLEPYGSAAEDAHRQLSDLRALTTDDAAQQAIVARMRTLVDTRFAQIENDIRLYRAGAVEAAGKQDIERGKQLRDSIRTLANEVFGVEERQLRERKEALSAARLRTWWAVGLGYGLVVLAVGSLYWNVKRYSRQTAEAEERLSKLNAELDARVRDRTALLEAREELLNVFVKYAPAAVAMLDRDMRYLQVSDRWCADFALDKSAVLGRVHYDVFPDIPERWKELLKRCLAGETLSEEEDRFDRADGSLAWLRWEIRPWGNQAGAPQGILIFAEDVTDRRRMEELLRESEATLRALLDTAAQAILAVDSDGDIAIANRMAGEMFGYEPAELLHRPLGILLPERFRRNHNAYLAHFMSHPRSRPMGTGIDLLGLRKDGSEFPIEVSLSSVPSSRGPLAVSFVSDITPRKQAEAALRNNEQQLRALAGNLLTAQEDERRRVARELHDDITQRLAFLSIELGKLGTDIPDSLPDVRARVRALQNQTMNASSEVRRLSHGLHPSVISDFGLSIALEEFCQEFEDAQGIVVRFEGFVENSRLNEMVATSFYRIAQESLQNAVTHGRATEADVTLSLVNGSIRLRVSDNGAGFPPASKPGLGLISMRERIRLVNGTLSVSSLPAKGTEVIASVPLMEGNYEPTAHSDR